MRMISRSSIWSNRSDTSQFGAWNTTLPTTRCALMYISFCPIVLAGQRQPSLALWSWFSLGTIRSARPKKSRCSTTYRVAASSSVSDGVRVRSSSMASVSTWAKAGSALSKPRKPSLARWRPGRWRSPENITTNPRRASGPNLSRAFGIAHMQPRSHPNLPASWRNSGSAF